MNKEEIMNVLNKYSLDKNEIVIIAGAALVLQGVVDKTHDIDIWVNEKYYNYLLNNYECKYERTNEYGLDCYMIDDIINFGLSFFPDNYVVIDGYKVASIDDCIRIKKFLNRDKDRELIKKYTADVR